MKHISILLIICSLTVCSWAQTQQGVVKTRGRIVNGVLQQGQGIVGAAIYVSGRQTIVSNGNDGNFSFPVIRQYFHIDSVKKKDYRLVDYNVCTGYQYSENPLRIVMEKPEQLKADLLAKERILRRNLQRQLQIREEEVDALNLTLEEKNRLLQEINMEREENEKIIKNLAQYYSTLDYDQLNEFQQIVSACLENGELPKADSLLRSKGDMKSRIDAVMAEQAAEAKEEKVLALRQRNLETSKAGTNKRIEDIAADCHSFFLRFSQDHQRDSAAYYLEMRASLDTTNVNWTNEAGKYISDYLTNYPKALKYYQRTLRQSQLQYGEWNNWTATAYNNIGSVFYHQGDNPKALEYYTKAMVIWEKVFGTELPYVAESYNNIGVVYSGMGDYTKAIEYHTKALSIFKRMLGTEDTHVAMSYNNIGSAYSNIGDFPQALSYYAQALTICEKVYGTEHLNTATTYNNIGLVYDHQDNYAKALESYTKALDIYEKIHGTEHPDVILSYGKIGMVYDRQNNFPKALEFFAKALAICEKVYGTEHPNVAMFNNSIGYIYFRQGEYPKALKYLTKALDINEKVHGIEHPDTQFAIGIIDYINKRIVEKEYLDALSSGDLVEFLADKTFTATIIDGESPARLQGMSGEYILLEFADWTIKSKSSLHEKNNEMRGKPKNLVVMKDSIISQHHFENNIGAQLGLKKVGREEKERIIKAYDEWKRNNL